MSEQQKLVIEILSGPLDGLVIALHKEAEWTCAAGGPLAFPWDDELGEPQARFTVDESGWSLEGCKSPHGMYRINQQERIGKDKIQLAEGDILKASSTWVLVREV